MAKYSKTKGLSCLYVHLSHRKGNVGVLEVNGQWGGGGGGETLAGAAAVPSHPSSQVLLQPSSTDSRKGPPLAEKPPTGCLLRGSQSIEMILVFENMVLFVKMPKAPLPFSK